METHAEFRSDKFPPYEGEEERIKPGLWGKRHAEYLVEGLTERGIETEEIIAEDWRCNSFLDLVGYVNITQP